MKNLRLMKRRRPKAVEITFVDPWSGEFCSGGTFQYTPERAASGFYTRSISRLRDLAKQWTGMRQPQLRVAFKWGQP
jgi:hypothetical protein